jgi:hypothetical protein
VIDLRWRSFASLRMTAAGSEAGVEGADEARGNDVAFWGLRDRFAAEILRFAQDDNERDAIVVGDGRGERE